jgi:hypothetical protein
MHRRRAVLDPRHMKLGAGEVDRFPPQANELGRAQAVPVSDENHRGITMRIVVSAGRLDQALDLRLSEVFPRPNIAIPPPFGWRWSTIWPIYGWGGDQPQIGFYH